MIYVPSTKRAPGDKMDAQTPYVNLKHCIDSAAAFFYNYLLVCIVYDSHNLDTRPRTL